MSPTKTTNKLIKHLECHHGNHHSVRIWTIHRWTRRHVRRLDRRLLLQLLRRARYGRNRLRRPHERRSLLLGRHLSPGRQVALLLLDHRLVQPARAGCRHDGYHIRLRGPHLQNCNRRHQLCTDRREDDWHLSRSVDLACAYQQFRRSAPPIPEQFIRYPPLRRNNLLRNRHTVQSTNPSVGQGSLRHVLRRNRRSGMERAGFTGVCGRMWHLNGTIHHHGLRRLGPFVRGNQQRGMECTARRPHVRRRVRRLRLLPSHFPPLLHPRL